MKRNHDGGAKAAAIPAVRGKSQRQRGMPSWDGLYRRVFEHAPNGMLILDGDMGRVMDANPAFLHLANRHLNACIGKSLWEIGVFPDAEAGMAMLRELRGHRPVRGRIISVATGDRCLLEAELSARRYTVDGRQVIQCDIRELGKASVDAPDLNIFLALLDKASDAIEVVDQDTLRFIYANEVASRMHGYSREEFLSLSVHDLDTHIAPEQMKHIDEVLREKRSIVFESIHGRKDGSRFPVEVHLSLVPIHGQDWRLAMVRDISERRKREADLQLFRALLDKASDAIEVIDPETLRYIDVNDTACRSLGYSRDELLGLSVWDIDTGMDSVRMDEAKALLQQGRSLVHESFHRRKDGSTFPVEVVVSQVQLDSTYNIAVARDISERRKAERLLRESETQLREAQHFGHLGHWSWRLTDHQAIWSDELFRIFGYEPRSMGLGLKGLLQAAHPDDLEMVRKLIRRATKAGESVDADFRIATPEGEVRWVHVKSTTSVDGDGKHIKVFGICQDITEHKRQEETLRQSLEQSILTIADTVEARDPYTAGHQRRVGELAMAIAREMALPEEQVQGIYLASLIHDLGKIHIPAEILSKPGRLSEVEYLMIKTHPQAGYDIVKNVKFPWPIADIILQHHERMDGSGYPQGLKEEQILLEARVIAVADVVESMTSHRPYRAGLGVEMALAEVEGHRGTRYDPLVVDTCLKLFRQDGYVLHD